MAKMQISEKSLVVLNYLKEHNGENMTAADIAVGLGWADASNEEDIKQQKKSVDGVATALQKRGFTKRIPAEIQLEDGTHKQVKFIQATEAGLAYDHEAAQAADAAAAAAPKAE